MRDPSGTLRGVLRQFGALAHFAEQAIADLPPMQVSTYRCAILYRFQLDSG